MDISERIRLTRESKNLKQSDVAEMLNTDRQNYSRLEKRGDKLTIAQIDAIASVLGVGILDLLTDDKKEKTESELGYEDMANAFDVQSDLIDSYEELIKSQNEMILQLQRDVFRILLLFEQKVILFFEKYNTGSLIHRNSKTKITQIIDYSKVLDSKERKENRNYLETTQILKILKEYDDSSYKEYDDNSIKRKNEVKRWFSREYEIQFTSIEIDKLTKEEIEELSKIIKDFKDFKIIQNKYSYLSDFYEYLMLSISKKNSSL